MSYLPAVVIWGLDRLQLLSITAVRDTTVSWPFLTTSTLAVALMLFLTRHR